MQSNAEVNPSTIPRLLTLDQLSSELQVPSKTIYYWVHRREIPYIKFGRHLRFERAAVVQAFREKTEVRSIACSPLESLINKGIPKGKVSFRRSLKSRDWNLAETAKE